MKRAIAQIEKGMTMMTIRFMGGELEWKGKVVLFKNEQARLSCLLSPRHRNKNSLDLRVLPGSPHDNEEAA
jgi:hypothetical protein